MLKANPKIWAIVIVICLVGQFLVANVPVWFGTETNNTEQTQIQNVQIKETER